MIVLHAAETIKGGVATVINSLVDYQEQQKEIDQVICLVPSDQLQNLTKSHNLKVFQFQRNGRNFFGMLSFFWSFLIIILNQKPNVVHLHSSFAGLIGRIAIFLSGRRAQTKIIYCPHAFSFLMETESYKQKIYLSVEKLLSNITDKIICVSRSEYKQAIDKGFLEEKLILIYNGVKPKNIKNNRMLNNKKNYKILFVGRFDFQKGIDVLADALKDLRSCQNEINYDFTLVGENVNNNDIIDFESSSKIKIRKLGWLKPHELEEQYLNHDAIVIPSRWEGFAMVPLEAMSFGLPIIASDISTFRELEPNSDKHILFFINKNELCKIFFNLDMYNLERNREIAVKVFNSNFSESKMKINTYKLYL